MKRYRVDIVDIDPYDVELEDMGDRSGKLDFVLASGTDRLLEALDDIVTAWELPGAHCELIDAIDAAEKLLKGEKP